MFEFSEIVRDHFYRPRNAGEFTPSANVITVSAATPDQGAVLQLQIRLAGQRIIAARFKAYGCPCCIAVASFISENVILKTLDEAGGISSARLIEALQLPRDKYYCALLGEDVIRAAIAAGQRSFHGII